jgi:tetratricopeptide (TPR) repeat protein
LLWRIRLIRKLAATYEDPLPMLEHAAKLVAVTYASPGANDAFKLAACEVACDRARCWIDRGAFVQARDELKTAAEHASAIVANITAARGPWLDAIAALRALECGALFHLGDADGAAAALGESIELRRAVLGARSADLTTHCRILIGEVRLGEILRDFGHTGGAAAAFARAVAVGEAFREVKTTSVDIRYRVAAAHEMLARAHLAQGRWRPAAEHADSAIKIARALLELDPRRTAWQRLLGFCLMTRGRMAIIDRGDDAARNALLEALAVREALASRWPDNSALQAEWADAWDALGDEHRTDNSAGAMSRYRRALDIREKLAGRQLEVAAYQLDVVYTTNQLAACLLRQNLGPADLDAKALLHAAVDRLDKIQRRGSLGDRGQYLNAVESALKLKLDAMEKGGPWSVEHDEAIALDTAPSPGAMRWAPPCGG